MVKIMEPIMGSIMATLKDPVMIQDVQEAEKSGRGAKQ